MQTRPYELCSTRASRMETRNHLYTPSKITFVQATTSKLIWSCKTRPANPLPSPQEGNWILSSQILSENGHQGQKRAGKNVVGNVMSVLSWHWNPNNRRLRQSLGLGTHVITCWFKMIWIDLIDAWSVNWLKFQMLGWVLTFANTDTLMHDDSEIENNLASKMVWDQMTVKYYFHFALYAIAWVSMYRW